MIQNQPGCDWYYFTFPVAVDCINIIFNSGTGIQTADLIGRCENGYYIFGTGWSDTAPVGFCSPNGPPLLTVLPTSGIVC
ncbi:MAG: hypothetical protein IPO92_18565 [Saprospiraceae bacterium]|nr:hypothetical protein [Saprospiraceae bacterium]